MKRFNTTGLCVPHKHYMVNIDERVQQIRAMVDRGDYFSINRGRQYGKTTTLVALERALSDDYGVISLDFLAQLRLQYLEREKDLDAPAFQSVVLAGVTDVRHLARRFETRTSIGSTAHGTLRQALRWAWTSLLPT